MTFLPVTTTRGSSTKFLQVKLITHVSRSFSSVSGFNVTEIGPLAFTLALDAAGSTRVVNGGGLDDLE